MSAAPQPVIDAQQGLPLTCSSSAGSQACTGQVTGQVSCARGAERAALRTRMPNRLRHHFCARGPRQHSLRLPAVAEESRYARQSQAAATEAARWPAETLRVSPAARIISHRQPSHRGTPARQHELAGERQVTRVARPRRRHRIPVLRQHRRRPWVHLSGLGFRVSGQQSRRL